MFTIRRAMSLSAMAMLITVAIGCTGLFKTDVKQCDSGKTSPSGKCDDNAATAPTLGSFAITAPSSTVASAATTVTWDASKGADTYDVVLSKNTDCSAPTIQSLGVTTTTMNVTGLSDKTTYYLCVTAKSAAASSLVASNAPYKINVAITPSTIAGVFSLVNDGYYRTADTVDLYVNFSKVVTVKGTPTLTLNTTSTTPTATYLSGSGTNKLTFRYTPTYRDRSTRLDYSSTAALNLAGGTITDSDGLAVGLTLATPGAKGSLSVNANLRINQPKGNVAKIANGDLHACAIVGAGKVKCWGYNSEGEAGVDNNVQIADTVPHTLANASYVALGRSAIQIGAGAQHSCAILDNGDLKCWGHNGNGQAGQDTSVFIGDSVPHTVANIAPINLGANRSAIQVVGGSSHTCALLDSGDVKCWGRSNSGQLGQDNTTNVGDSVPNTMANLQPVNLGGLKATYIAANYEHTCAILSSGAVKCWGNNNAGALGQDNTTNVGDSAPHTMANLAPINLGLGRTATHIAIGLYLTCAVLDDASVKCWGINGNGELGQDNTTNVGDSVPHTMANLNAINLGSGFRASMVACNHGVSCAVSDAGVLKCWGGGANGQLGKDSTVNIGDSVPHTMANLTPITLNSPVAEISASIYTIGGTTLCARLTNNGIQCWGNNANGQLGRDKTTNVGDGVGDAMSTLYNLSL